MTIASNGRATCPRRSMERLRPRRAPRRRPATRRRRRRGGRRPHAYAAARRRRRRPRAATSSRRCDHRRPHRSSRDDLAGGVWAKKSTYSVAMPARGSSCASEPSSEPKPPQPWTTTTAGTAAVGAGRPAQLGGNGAAPARVVRAHTPRAQPGERRRRGRRDRRERAHERGQHDHSRRTRHQGG